MLLRDILREERTCVDAKHHSIEFKLADWSVCVAVTPQEAMASAIFRSQTDLKVHLGDVAYNRNRSSPEPQEDVVQLPLQLWSRNYCIIQGRALMSG